jgi:hypothetical protein
MPRRPVIAAVLAITAGCSGGGGADAPAVNPPVITPAPTAPPPVQQPVSQSPGGIWHGVSTNNETLNLFVDEAGNFRSLETKGVPPTAPPLFGSGAVVVNAGGQLDGAYDSGRPFATIAEHCEFTGVLIERVSMSIKVDCTDDAGATRSSSLILGYDRDYEGGSSLAMIAGNYAFSARPSNFLNIDGNGIVFGVYDNGPNCTVNGTVEVIDTRYNFYRFEWRLSLCKAPLLKFEGATMTGFGVRNVRSAPPGSVLALVTGVVGGHLEGVSLLYQP